MYLPYFREAVKGIFKFTDINLAREAKNRLIHDYIDQPKVTIPSMFYMRTVKNVHGTGFKINSLGI